LRAGRRQREAELDVLAACVNAGASGVSFWPLLMTGPNSNLELGLNALADYRFLDRSMKVGELSRVDVGCAQEHYEGDVGRTAPVSGVFDEGQSEAWNLLIASYRAGLRAIKPGLTPEDVFAVSKREAERIRPTLRTRFGKRTADLLLAPAGTADWALHGVGISSSEWNPDTLRAGNVLAFEPNLVVDGVGLYLEDMVLVTRTGAEVLTTGLPYTAKEIEAVMRRAPKHR
jgi:Xaa-Pro aminopeptidase